MHIAQCHVRKMFSVSLIKATKRNSTDTLQRNYKLWNSEEKKSFVGNFDIIKVSDIEMRLDHLTHSDSFETSQNDINEIISDIGSLFISESAKSRFGYKNAQNNRGVTKKCKSKPWFHRECKTARNLYHIASYV